MEHQLKGEFIELIKLLKFYGIASTGGEAKMMVEESEVKVNGQLENRKRYKVRKGDKIEAREEVITVI